MSSGLKLAELPGIQGGFLQILRRVNFRAIIISTYAGVTPNFKVVKVVLSELVVSQCIVETIRI